MRILLDTDAYSEMRRGRPSVAELVYSASEIVFSTVVGGELLHGFRRGTRFEENRRLLDEFLSKSSVTVLPVSLHTADRFGRIMASLDEKGRRIPSNDIWIAAHAFESGAVLVSFDRHFDEIPGLVVTHPRK